MPRLENEIAIAAPPEAVWALVGDLEATTEWIPGVVEARVEGNRRVCRTADGHEIHEEVVGSDVDRTVTYRQTQVPLPIADSRGSLRVVPAADGARVEWTAEFDAPDDVAAMVDEYYKQTLEMLRQRVESGSG